MIKILHPYAWTDAAKRASPCRLFVWLFGMLALGACQASETSIPKSRVVAAAEGTPTGVQSKQSRMWMTVGERRFALTLANTDAARVFAARLPLALDMSDLNGNEKKFDFSSALPANASRAGTIRNGDLMLYGSNTLVLFYLTFESAYSYTRLGRVDDPSGLADALGKGNARVEFSSLSR